ncbi:unnamed protein product [Closterium sp. NIES-65]|nr:unnamed protein product [Closterium sp. NIES-65]
MSHLAALRSNFPHPSHSLTSLPRAAAVPSTLLFPLPPPPRGVRYIAYDDKGFTVGGRDLDSSILCVGDVALCWSPSCLADVTPDSLPQCVLALLTPSLHSSLSVPSCPATTSFSPRSHLVLTSFSPRSHLVLTSFSPLSHLFLTSFSPLSHLFLTSFSPRSHLFLTSFSPLSHLFSPLSHLFLTSFSPLSHTPNNRRGLRLSLPSILPIFLWLICEFHQFFPISLPGLQFRLYLPPSLPYFLLTSTSLPAPLYPLFIPSTPLPSFCPPCHPCLSLPHSLALFQLIRQQPATATGHGVAHAGSAEDLLRRLKKRLPRPPPVPHHHPSCTELLLLGTGQRMQAVPGELRHFVRACGMKLEVLSTVSAVCSVSAPCSLHSYHRSARLSHRSAPLPSPFSTSPITARHRSFHAQRHSYHCTTPITALHHSYHRSAPLLSPFSTTPITALHHSYHRSAPLVSPLSTTPITALHHSYHRSAPLVSPLSTTPITAPHHSYHRSAPLLSPLSTTPITALHHSYHRSAPLLSLLSITPITSQNPLLSPHSTTQITAQHRSYHLSAPLCVLTADLSHFPNPGPLRPPPICPPHNTMPYPAPHCLLPSSLSHRPPFCAPQSTMFYPATPPLSLLSSHPHQSLHHAIPPIIPFLACGPRPHLPTYPTSTTP